MPGDARVASDHAALETIRQLRDRRRRDARRLFVAEGLRFLVRALAARADIRQVVACPELSPPGTRRVLREARRRGVPVLTVDGHVALELSRADEGHGVLFVAAQALSHLVKPPSDAIGWIAVGDVTSPGNLGTITRTLAAAGMEGLVLLSSAPDPWHPTAVRASMGALFNLAVIRAGHAELRAWVRRHRCLVVGATGEARLPYHRARFDRPTVVILGGEQHGLSEADRRLARRLVNIPMARGIDSLNVGVAAGVVAFEVQRQRRGRPTSLRTDSERAGR